MPIVILDAMEKESSISNILIDVCKEKGEEISCFKLKDMNISPCRSCGACSFKSPGKCVIKDDIHDVLRAIAKCSTLIMLTPVRFGGYSSCLKKVVDKFMLLCLPSYTVKYGHLLHPARYGSKFLLGIGVYEGNSKAQEESFGKLVENNALNVQYAHRALIVKPSGDMGVIRQEIGSILREAC